MNLKETLDWLGAVQDSFPDLSLGTIQGVVERLGAGGGRWEAGLAGGEGFSTVAVRYFGPASDFAAWLELAASQFGVRPEELRLSAPAEGFPWLSATWDLRSGQWRSARLLGQGPRRGLAAGARLERGRKAPAPLRCQSATFRPSELGEPALEKVLADFSRLCPVADRVADSSPDGPPRWSLRLREGLPWSGFLRCDLSKGFSAGCSQSSFLMRRLQVRELAFEGDLLWAYCGG